MRAKVARSYLDVAELAATDERDVARNVAAGNAVLAAVAASDAICCFRVGRRSRGDDHRSAISLLRKVRPDGEKLANDLETALGVKDLAHYGERLLGAARLKASLRAASRLVDAAERVTSTS